MEKNISKKLDQIVEETIEQLERLSFFEHKDYSLGWMSEGDIRNSKVMYYLTIKFKYKGKKKIVDFLESQGWTVDTRNRIEAVELIGAAASIIMKKIIE